MDEKTIESLANWTPPVETQTKYGPRLLRKAAVTPAFSAAWKADKDAMKALGASWSKDPRTGTWELVWWQQITAEEIQRRRDSVEASRAVSADIDLPRPAGLEYMPFQKAGIKFSLDRDGVLLADAMGLGKTIQAVGIINADPAIKSAVIVCPKSLMLNWKRELTRWLTKSMTIGICHPDADIVIYNYEALGKHIGILTSHEWGALIVDEAHFIKNQKAQRSVNVKAIAEKAKKNIRLTGTPIVNRPVELYNIICDLHPAWRNFKQFTRRYCGWDKNGAQNLDELQTKLRETVMIRRLKEEVLTELPRKIRQIIEIEPDDNQRAAIRREQAAEQSSESRLAELRAAVELSKAESEAAYTEAVERLRGAVSLEFTELSKMRHETALAKVPNVIEHVRAILEDGAEEKVIIAAHHHDVIDLIGNGLIDFFPVVLTGETPLEARQEAVDKFQNTDKHRVFIGSITAAGVGITLTRARLVVFAELDWVPGNISQMEDRAHRIGQIETVLVQHIVLEGSIDARMAEVLVEKQKIIDSALDVKHPERQAPAYRPREAASTENTNRDALMTLALKLTDKQKEAARAALMILTALNPDGASVRNGVGFNKIDTLIGSRLAMLGTLTPRQEALAWKMVQKYKRQLPADVVDALAIGEKQE